MLCSKSKSCPRTNYHIGHDPSMKKYIITYYAVTTNESEWQNNRFDTAFTRSVYNFSLFFFIIQTLIISIRINAPQYAPR